MANTNTDDIIDSLAESLVDGVAETQIADRRERKFNPNEILDAVQRIDSRNSSPFIRVGFTGRQV